jgi:pimeloyl-ACP methyl ester carboxylesterase
MRSIRRLTLVSLAAASLVSGCETGSSDEPQPIAFTPGAAPAGTGFVAMYAPPVDNVPYPNDIYNPTGTKLAVPVKRTSPLADALNTLDGFSTTAVISAPFNAPLDAASLIPWNPLTMGPTAAAASIVVMKIAPGTPAPLVAGTDYTVRISAAAGSGGGILEIVPLKPLAPRTRYAFIITNGVRSTANVAAGADLVFGAVRDTYLAGGTSVPGQPALDPLFLVIPPLLEAARAIGIDPRNVVVAWSMLTQSTTDVLDVVDATTALQDATLGSAGITTAQLGLRGWADIYAGYIEVPYYGDPANPLTSFWINSQLVPPNVQNPTPIVRGGLRRIPLLATLPNAAAPGPPAKPAGGWPVVIFQHGITLNRTVMLALADSFAAAGFAVVAIDLPLHGITDTTSPLYQAPNERHFNLDNVGAVGVFAPDGQIDNGWQILNVANPLNARDHIRQAVADTIVLKRSLSAFEFPNAPNPDLDGSRIHFVGSSLGSIISGVFLGVDTEIRTATLQSPAGPWTSILTDPQAIDFGAPIRRALAAQGLPQGTIGFDNFVRDLQTVIDPVDPVNYAIDAAATHPIHVIEILGDTAVPNGPTDYIAQLWGSPSVSTTTPAGPPGAPGSVEGIVRFTAGAHSSLFNPQPNAAVTQEMQQQTVFYAATGGGQIRINNTSVVQ